MYIRKYVGRINENGPIGLEIELNDELIGGDIRSWTETQRRQTVGRNTVTPSRKLRRAFRLKRVVFRLYGVSVRETFRIITTNKLRDTSRVCEIIAHVRLPDKIQPLVKNIPATQFTYTATS